MSKNSFIENIEVKTPCSENWDEMRGNDKMRFCSHCSKSVNNLSALTRKQALKIVREAKGGICVRYVKNPATRKTVFADKFYQITSRAGIAAGVLGASLSLSTLTYAQSETIKNDKSSVQTQVSPKDEKSDVKESTTITQDEINALPKGETTFVTLGFAAAIPIENPFHRAVADDDLEQVKNMIARGENVNGRDKSYGSITPLFLAVENGNLEMAQTLLSFGAKINARNNDKQTPLMLLDDDAAPDLVNLLIAYGAKVNLTDAGGNTALMLAARSVKPEVLRILIVHGANLDAANKEGQTALMNAANEDNAENVRALLEAGANVNLKNKEGETAWDLTGNEEIEKLLESYGAIVENN